MPAVRRSRGRGGGAARWKVLLAMARLAGDVALWQKAGETSSERTRIAGGQGGRGLGGGKPGANRARRTDLGLSLGELAAAAAQTLRSNTWKKTVNIP